MDRRAWLKLGGLSFGAMCTGAPNLEQLLAGADVVVAKPVDWNLLDSKIQELTDARPAAKAS